MQVGDTVIFRGPPVHLWEIVGIYLGAVGQESIIELRPLSHKPLTNAAKTRETSFVPEPLIRGLVFARATRENSP